MPRGNPEPQGRLGEAAGLCGECRHALLNVTRRGTAYRRCGRARWDARLVRYPHLPVHECPGFEARDEARPDSPRHR